MKDGYDFSAAKRGKFFRNNATLVSPVHLEPDVLASLSELAAAQGVPLNALVNSLIREHVKRRS
ncbi:hypothetical protein FXV83_27985 [Bradyrhizobium hipponense]|uniref:Uncharacterized protein n=1 Tax=Bradyrhizobium hipponense TaxID=2605638 RepID=A0A5S4YJ15_9BRAD|nr:hypothetical protein FXV83_27985 [Bradyrhizobium hipponense]